MSKKLTLRLDEDVIERAKAYAADRDTSVSRLVENYFDELTGREEGEQGNDLVPESLGPFTSRLARRTSTSETEETDYYEYLQEKHK
ncbi:DUF6364 family protein [Salinibacter ruber]|uniref:Uncharacterized protein n=1 Tax=Salinibacter ruber TaxID=146919 RepID=A0A9X2Q5T2_9BACT|nr:DUF6364 family protein [Salinibacter ruber]MCS3655846.1 hypothetical protein [Salinibacter ruber]MCS3659290.1 hypothetical protein [Salinibacter ruber]MCS3696729.1 hypothetical protein [Salinibacter ruber]MCS3699792.1 hypothetical protein [Salinibacter ruber]MCS3703311.1 hypothetical protein [Salinibacter ruber]